MKLNCLSFAVILFMVFALVLTSCGDGAGSGGDGKTYYLGETLKLSGQVYIRSGDAITPYTGSDVTVLSNASASGSITNGQLSIIIGAPPILFSATEATEEFLQNFNNVQINPASAQVLGLELNCTIPPGGLYELRKLNSTPSTFERVWYFYADRDVSITGTGKNWEEHDITYTNQNLELNMKQGWNAVYYASLLISETTGKARLSLGNPSHLYWRLTN